MASNARAPHQLAAPRISRPTTFLPPARVAELFLRWISEHDLAGEMPVDDVWEHASQDFGPALGIIMPTRQTFLAALKRRPRVFVTHDRRVRDRDGRVVRKTTFYALPAQGAVANDACEADLPLFSAAA